MIDLSVDKNFISGWKERYSGTGSTSVIDGVLTTIGASGDTAVRDFYFPIQKGQRIKIGIWARDNGSVQRPRVSIDMVQKLSDFTILDNIEIDQTTEWRYYEMQATVPFDSNYPYARLVLGKWGSMLDVNCSYKSPTIQISGGYGVAITYGLALIKLNYGVPSLHPDFKTLGIKNMVFNGTYLDVWVDLPLHTETSSDLLNFPCAFVSGTGDSYLIPLAGNIIPDNGATRVRIKWTNGSSIQDVSGFSSLYVFLRLDL